MDGGDGGAWMEGAGWRDGWSENAVRFAAFLYVTIRVSYSGSRARCRGILMPDLMLCRILMLVWSFGALR